MTTRDLSRRTFLALFATTILGACAPSRSSSTAQPQAPAGGGQQTAAALGTPPAASGVAGAIHLGAITALFDNAFILAPMHAGIYKQAGIDLSITEFQDGNTMTRAVVSDQIDTGEMGIPQIFPADEAGADLKVLYDCGQELPNYLRLGMPVRQQNIATRDGLLRQFFIAHSFAHRWALQHRDEVVRSAVEDVKQDEAAAAANWDTYINGNMVTPDFTITEAQIDYMQQLNLDDGSQKAKLPTDRVLDTRYVQAIQETLGPYHKA